MLFSHNSFVKSQQISAFKMSSPSSSNETSCNKLSIKYILNPIDECSTDKKIKFLFTSESYKTPSRKNKYRTAPGRGHRSWIFWVVPPVPEAAAAKGAARSCPHPAEKGSGSWAGLDTRRC